MQNGIFDSIFNTSSPQPDGKQDDRCFVCHVAFDYVHMMSGSKWSMIGPRPCAYANVLMLIPFSLVKATT